MFITSRESIAIHVLPFHSGLSAPTLEPVENVFLRCVFSGGKLQVRASYNWVNIRGSSRNFRFLPVSSGFHRSSWYFGGFSAPKCCVQAPHPPQLIVVLPHTEHYFARKVTKDARLSPGLCLK